MEKGQVRLPPHLAPSLAQSLRDSGRVQAKPAIAPTLLEGTVEGLAIRVSTDGHVDYDEGPECHALLVQCIKGILPTSDASFLVGIDESGLGGEAKEPIVGIVLIAADIRAELLVKGIRDCKTVAESRLPVLASIVEREAMRWGTIPVKGTVPGQSHASAVARAIAKAIVEWDDNGHLPARAQITIDQTDAQALQAGFGDNWDRFKDRIRIEAKADEECVEVAAASILARANKTPAPIKAATTKAAGVFHIGKWEQRDRDQVLAFLHRLQNSYPDIGKWIGKVGDPKAVWTRIEKGDIQLLVARMDNEVAGFSLSQPKDARNWKLSTFYVAPAYRRQHIGHRLLDMEFQRLAGLKVRRVMVTFGHEEFQSMWDFFLEHGFRVDGISPQRYRDNSYEVVMGKRFRYGTVALDGFRAFVEHDLFRMQGFNIKRIDGHTFFALPTPSLVQGPATKAARLAVRVTTSPTPEQELQAVLATAAQHDAAPVLVSAYGFPSDKALPDDVEVFDALVLERIFAPVHIDRPEDEDMVIPIQPDYVKVLFPNPKQATLAPTKVGLRTTNVYYRVAKNHEGFRRGSRVFFYESDGRGIFGVAQLESIISGSAKKVHAKTRGMGAWSLADIDAHTPGKDVAAYRFSSFLPLRTPQGLDAIQQLQPKFNPITVYRIPRAIGNEILKQGGIA